MRGTYRFYRPRVALVGAEPSKPFNAAPLLFLGACAALVVAVLKNERDLGKG